MAAIVLSDFEAAYIKRGVNVDLRGDGRSRKDYRYFELKTGVVSNTSGSAEIKLERTSITVGVKAEIGTPDPLRPHKGRIEFFVDCSALASPKFEGREGEGLGQYLAYRLSELYHNSKCINLESLCIIPGQQCWVVYADALVLEWSGGVLDCLSIAVKAALSNTKIPKLTLVGEEGEEQEIEISDNPYDTVTLDTNNVPIIVTLSMIGDHFVVDASHEEEACSLCHISMGVDSSSRICGTLKEGPSNIKHKHYNEAISLASEVGKSILERINVSLMNSSDDETAMIM